MCFIALLGLLAPRIVFFLLWLFTPAFVLAPFRWHLDLAIAGDHPAAHHNAGLLLGGGHGLRLWQR